MPAEALDAVLENVETKADKKHQKKSCKGAQEKTPMQRFFWCLIFFGLHNLKDCIQPVSDM